MLIELLLTATCLLEPASTYKPPAGWTIQEVTASGRQNICHGGGITNVCWAIEPRAVEKTTVVLTRSIQPGETVTPPSNCTLTSTLPAERKVTP